MTGIHDTNPRISDSMNGISDWADSERIRVIVSRHSLYIVYDRCLWQCAGEGGFEPSSLAAISLEPGLEIIREDYCFHGGLLSLRPLRLP